MTASRDRCPDCGQKQHPWEMEALFRGRKLDCWDCGVSLKARPKYNLGSIAQSGVALWALVETLSSSGQSGWWPLVAAGVIFVLVTVLPPGLVHGAPWVRLVASGTGSDPEASR